MILFILFVSLAFTFWTSTAYINSKRNNNDIRLLVDSLLSNLKQISQQVPKLFLLLLKDAFEFSPYDSSKVTTDVRVINEKDDKPLPSVDTLPDSNELDSDNSLQDIDNSISNISPEVIHLIHDDRKIVA